MDANNPICWMCMKRLKKDCYVYTEIFWKEGESFFDKVADGVLYSVEAMEKETLKKWLAADIPVDCPFYLEHMLVNQCEKQ